MTSRRTRPGSGAPAALRAVDLVGGWHLVSWEISYDDGARVTRPFGEKPVGLIEYTPNGCMSATIAAAERPALSGDNPRRAPATERAAAFDSFFAYAGTYRVRGRAVVHELTVALNPAMVGTQQVRQARLSGDLLELSATEPAGSGTRTHRIVWRRHKQTAARRARVARRNATARRR